MLSLLSLLPLVAHAGSSLLPYALKPLPHGSVKPEGWLYRQLKIQGDGLSGHFQNFWGPVANSTWTGGSNKEGDWLEIWPYVLQGYVPQAILLQDPEQLAQVQTWLDYLLEQQAAAGTGWLGPSPASRDGGMLYWPQWPIVLSFLAWREYKLSGGEPEDPRYLAGSLAWLHNASGMLETRPMGRDWSGTRWQDFLYAIQAVQDCPSTPDSEQPFLTALSSTVYTQGVTHGIDWASYYTPPNFPKEAVPSWDYLPHGVNNALAQKGGAVSWRAGLEVDGNLSSWQRDGLIMQYHGSPSGVFLADECLAGNMPAKGSETCLVVEQLFSLNIVHEIQGDAFFAERAETIAYNAMGGIGTKDLWTRVYLQQPNEVFAGHSNPHVWNTDGDDSTTYSLQDNYECCTANFNQGWPRMVQHMLHTTLDGGVAVSILGPVSAHFPGVVGYPNLAMNVSGEYPFEDNITVTLSGLAPNTPITLPLYIRIPSWATDATLSIAGNTPLIPVGATSNGTMYKVSWGGVSSDATGSATVTLATNPSIRAVPGYNGALSIFRGALLYALRLDETFEVTGGAVGEPRAADYIVSQPGCDLSPSAPTCTAPWNIALVVDDATHPASGWSFVRTGGVPAIPFAGGLWGASNLEITAYVRQVNAWGLDRNAAAPPPTSPVACGASGDCSPPYPATFVPYASTHLRMAVTPWTSRPPCGSFLPANTSSPTRTTVIRGPGVGGFDTYGGAGIVDNGGPSNNLRSGSPGDVSTGAWLTGVMDSGGGGVVTGVSLAFQYVAGYGGDGAPGGATVEVVALTPGPCGGGGGGGGGGSALIASLYTSPPLEHFPYDVCPTCYSPPVVVNVTGLSLNATGGIVFALRFVDNDRNVQLKLPLDITVHCALYESLADSFQIDSQLPALHTALLKDAIQSTSPSVDARAWLFRRIFDRTLADLQFTPHSEAPLPAGFPPPGKVGVVTRKAYPAYRCATDPGGQFGALFGHISSHGVAMTAPVISSLEQPTMSFVYASTALGKPGSGGGRVVVQDLPPLMVLSVGIRGDMGHSNVTLARRVLEEALSSGKFGVAAPGGDWRTLGYNSPMVPNERRFWELQVPLKGE